MGHRTKSDIDKTAANGIENFAATIKTMIPSIARDLRDSVAGPKNLKENSATQTTVVEDSSNAQPLHPRPAVPSDDESVQILKDLIRHLDL